MSIRHDRRVQGAALVGFVMPAVLNSVALMFYDGPGSLLGVGALATPYVVGVMLAGRGFGACLVVSVATYMGYVTPIFLVSLFDLEPGASESLGLMILGQLIAAPIGISIATAVSFAVATLHGRRRTQQGGQPSA